MIKKLTNQNKNDIIAEALMILKRGGIVILPFDTVYGIIADTKKESALEKIFNFKKRDKLKTIGIAATDYRALAKIAVLNRTNQAFINKRTPGPYTFILPLKEKAALSKYCQMNGTVGIRIPDSDLIQKISLGSGGLIAQTSANKSGEENCYSIFDLKNQYSGRELDEVDLVIDAGQIKSAGPSRIFDLSKADPVEIERI